MNVMTGLLILNFCLIPYVIYLLLKKDTANDQRFLSSILSQVSSINFHISEIDREYKQIVMDLRKISNNCTDMKIDIIKMRTRKYNKKTEIK